MLLLDKTWVILILKLLIFVRILLSEK